VRGDKLASPASSSGAPLSSGSASGCRSEASQAPTWIISLSHLKAQVASSLSVRGEEGSLVVASSLWMQEMGPALSNHHLKTHKRMQHILVAQLQISFSPLISSDIFPGLHGMIWIKRNTKVDLEEQLLPLQQDPATRASSPEAPLHPPAVIIDQKTRLILATTATSCTTRSDPFVCSERPAWKCLPSSFLLMREGP